MGQTQWSFREYATDPDSDYSKRHIIKAVKFFMATEYTTRHLYN